MLACVGSSEGLVVVSGEALSEDGKAGWSLIPTKWCCVRLQGGLQPSTLRPSKEVAAHSPATTRPMAATGRSTPVRHHDHAHEDRML